MLTTLSLREGFQTEINFQSSHVDWRWQAGKAAINVSVLFLHKERKDTQVSLESVGKIWYYYNRRSV